MADQDQIFVDSQDQPVIYKPELLQRKGEMIAWILAFLVSAAWAVLRWRGLPINPALTILAAVLLLAALSISLGNWMDRKTTLRYDQNGIKFTNGLRRVRLTWDEVEQIRVAPSQWGKKVHVIGVQSYFSFRTLGEVKVQNEVKGQMGFKEGERILKEILALSGLNLVKQNEQVYYYGRG